MPCYRIRHNRLLWLLAFVPLVFAVHKLKPEAHSPLFVLSVLAIVPLAALLSHATESVAAKTGDADRRRGIDPSQYSQICSGYTLCSIQRAEKNEASIDCYRFRNLAISGRCAGAGYDRYGCIYVQPISSHVVVDVA